MVNSVTPSISQKDLNTSLSFGTLFHLDVVDGCWSHGVFNFHSLDSFPFFLINFSMGCLPFTSQQMECRGEGDVMFYQQPLFNVTVLVLWTKYAIKCNSPEMNRLSDTGRAAEEHTQESLKSQIFSVPFFLSLTQGSFLLILNFSFL